MAYHTAVVRKNNDGNFVILFPEQEAYGDNCRAFVPAQQCVQIQDLESHKMDYISRGMYLQATQPVSQEEADRIMRIYSAKHCRVKATYRAMERWERKT